MVFGLIAFKRWDPQQLLYKVFGCFIGRRMSIQKMQFRCTPRVTT